MCFLLSVMFQVVTQICQMIIGPISLIFCGHLGDAIKLDGAALAISVSTKIQLNQLHTYYPSLSIAKYP